MLKYLIVLDPGQSSDPFAIQIYRAVPIVDYGVAQMGTKDRIMCKDDLIMQYKIQDTRYKVVCKFVVELMNREDMYEQTSLVMDATGIGRAIKEEFQDAGIKSLIPISYTAGGRVNYQYLDTNDQRFNTSSGGYLNFKRLDQINVPKADMVDAARIALEQHQVRIAPNLPYLSDFKLQMVSFTGKMSPSGYTSFNNSSDDIHDEWVNCLMMRSWFRMNFKGSFSVDSVLDAHGGKRQPDIADYGIFDRRI